VLASRLRDLELATTAVLSPAAPGPAGFGGLGGLGGLGGGAADSSSSASAASATSASAASSSPSASSTSAGRLRLMSYNLLADSYRRNWDEPGGVHSYCDPALTAGPARLPRLLSEIFCAAPDVACL
jgi:mRNA deadenylase 3'-5' endonuclease subunit Ccr4